MKFKKLAMAMAITAMPMAIMAQNKVLGAGIKAENMDLSVKPGTDFYQYACGGWIKKNPLPAAYSRYGSFDKLAEDNNKKINSILTDLSGKRNTPGSLEQKIGDLYNLAMDSVRLNKDGVAPLMPTIQRLEGAKSIDDLMYSMSVSMAVRSSLIADSAPTKRMQRTISSISIRAVCHWDSVTIMSIRMSLLSKL